jgi:DNA adenine methylase
VNSRGDFNVPYGHLANPRFFTKAELTNFGAFMRSASIRNVDFEDSVSDAVAGDFVYFDPPYIEVSPTASHTAYNVGGFDMGQQVRLRDLVNELVARGVYVLVSNSNTPGTSALYASTPLIPSSPSVRRSISAKTASRTEITEYLGRSYSIEGS